MGENKRSPDEAEAFKKFTERLLSVPAEEIRAAETKYKKARQELKQKNDSVVPKRAKGDQCP